MTSPQQDSARPPAGRWRALLVLGLLAGLLAMHALAPGGTVHEHAGTGNMTAAVPGPTASALSLTSADGCHGDGDCGGGHLHHADSTCVSGAVGGGPLLPALVPDPVAAPARADALRSCAATAPDGARAPPSLAELQLLRI
ncbi:DUF6153 family protein [Streptomyces sp. NPDC005574]|uniref:DUF6153 family protein n=1 Tax=Streptomyces sp. NPDC005574 TaxID=3156891 RepID=UPI0033B5DAB0